MANIFRVTLVYTMYGQTMNNVIHFSGPSSDPAQMSVLADEVIQNLIPKLAARQIQNVTWTQVRVRLLESQFATFNKSLNLNGINSANNGNLSFISWVIQWKTALAGRRGRGRIYLGGVPDRIGDFGFIQAQTILAWQNEGLNLLAIFGPSGSSTFRLGVCPSKPPFQFTQCTAIDINPIVRCQRRRNIGVGV